ncbi:MAG: anhydro-N-acetylmuramic acid kinase [Pseudomonadota bacterium]
MLAIGLMSGTSCDGVDAALVETDGESIQEFIVEAHIPYPMEFQAKLLNLMKGQGNLAEIEKELTYYHFETIKQLGQTKAEIIGFHGQTVAHNPKDGICHQIGNPHLLAHLTGTSVVSDFRRRDVARGGQGSPLVPIFHKALMKGQPYPVAVINIGGLANVTYVSEEALIGGDTGPGNALINDMMLKCYNRSYDKDGEIAKSSNVDYDIIKQVMQDSFFRKPPPKSLDRNHFGFVNDLVSNLSPQDAIATLTMLTVETIAKGVPSDVRAIYLCGGGAKNITLVSWLSSKIKGIDISSIDTLGYKSDYIEAQAFAFLAVRCIKNLPSSFQTTTGVSRDTVAGVVVHP